MSPLSAICFNFSRLFLNCSFWLWIFCMMSHFFCISLPTFRLSVKSLGVMLGFGLGLGVTTVVLGTVLLVGGRGPHLMCLSSSHWRKVLGCASPASFVGSPDHWQCVSWRREPICGYGFSVKIGPTR